MILQITPIELPQAEAIATLVAAIVALSLALQAAVGPTVMYLTEIVKDAFPGRGGSGGMIALTISLFMGATFGLMAALSTGVAGRGEGLLYVCIGLIAGAFVAAGAVQSHKAAATVNTEAASAIQDGKELKEYQKAEEKKEAQTTLYAEMRATGEPHGSYGSAVSRDA